MFFYCQSRGLRESPRTLRSSQEEGAACEAMGELYHNMDFEFYDCKVKTFEANVQTHELWLHCLYHKCEPVTIRYQGVEAVDGLGILPNKVIEYITCHHDEKKDCNRYEIKFQELAERTIIWADRMGRTENESIVSLS